MIIAPENLRDEDIYLAAGDQFGDGGWWGDRWKEIKKGVKAVQSNQAVRDLEKSAVKVGSKALRGAVETELGGVADTALTSLGAPERAPFADKLIDKGVKKLEKKGTDYLDQKIDASGNGHGGVRYMSAGGGMCLAGSGTQVGLVHWYRSLSLAKPPRMCLRAVREFCVGRSEFRLLPA